jgi:hypothetical protein
VLADPHLVNTLIATAICDCRKDHPNGIDPEEAKQIAKCILEALTDAGLQISRRFERHTIGRSIADQNWLLAKCAAVSGL